MRRKNIPYIISYILAICVVLLGTLFYRQPVLTALLLLMLLLPVLSVMLCSRAKEKLSVSFDTLPVAVPFGKADDTDTADKNNGHVSGSIVRGSEEREPECGFRLVMRVANSSLIPLLNCMLVFKYGNRFYPNEKANEMVFAAPAHSAESYVLMFDASMPGLFEFETETIYVTDLLHLKTWKIPFAKRVKTAVLPEEAELPNVEIKKAALEEEAENSLSGELSREVRQIREYAPGDRLRDMHWKQTARLDEPMVRDFERMRESFYVLFPVVEPGEGTAVVSGAAGTGTVSGKMRENLKIWYSLALKLIKRGETVYTVIYDTESRTFEKYKASSEEELIKTVYELYCGTEPGFRASEELIGRLKEEIRDVVVIRDGKIAQP